MTPDSYPASEPNTFVGSGKVWTAPVPNQPSAPDEWELRNIVGRWLRIRAEHVEESVGIAGSAPRLSKDDQRAMLIQIANDAEHSWLLPRLFRGDEPLSFEDWITTERGS